MQVHLKFSLRVLILASALVPLAAWGVFQYRERQQRAEAQQRLTRIARTQPSDDETIEHHWSLRPGSDFVSLSLGRQPAPQQLLADCRRARTRIHVIKLNDDCLVDLDLARQIAGVPNLAELSIDSRTQIEPAAFPILLAAAPTVILPYDQFQAIRTLRDPVTPPHHLFLWSLPADLDELKQCLRDAVEWGPRSLYLSAPYRLNRVDPETLPSEPMQLRGDLTRLQLANPQMLITIRGLKELTDTTPQYPWKTAELKEMYERRFLGNIITDEEANNLTKQLLQAEPQAWPLQEEAVRDDHFSGKFDRDAEARATALIAVAPWSPSAHFNIGIAHFMRGEYDRSIESLERAVRCARFGFDEWIQEHDFVNQCVRVQAAAHVAAGRRTAGLEVLERHAIGHREDNRFAAIVFTAVWIQCTSPGARPQNTRAREALEFAAQMLSEGGVAVFDEKRKFAQIALNCLEGRFEEAQADYDPIAKNLNPNVEPRFRAEFKRLGECIQQRRPFVTDYVPVNPFWN